MKLSAHIEEWQLKQPLRINGQEWRSIRSVVVQVAADGYTGRGEAQGVFYAGETVDTIIARIDGIAGALMSDPSRLALLGLLPSGGARNAIDCALWDWEAKRSGKSIWELTDISPAPVSTVFTIGIEATPELMADRARAAQDCTMLKIKLDADLPLERMAAVRAARPDATVIVDANEAWDFAQLVELLPSCVELGIGLIEQPLPRGGDDELEGFESPILLAADESCLDTGGFEHASRRYDVINVKLDKTGGLTEALRLAAMAKDNGCKLMVGCMCGTSLSMAPSLVIAQLCEFVDIDGPLLLKHDHPDGLRYRAGVVSVFERSFWG